MDNLVCPKCHGNNIIIQEKTKIITKKAHRSIIMWILFWWWAEAIMWICFTIPRLIIALFVPSKQIVTSQNYKEYVCQTCGYSGSDNSFIKKGETLKQTNGLITTHTGFDKYFITTDFDKLYNCLIYEILPKHGKIKKNFSNYIEVKIKPHLKPFTNSILMNITFSKQENGVQLEINSKCNDGAIGLNSIEKITNLLFDEIKQNLNLTHKDITKV